MPSIPWQERDSVDSAPKSLLLCIKGICWRPMNVPPIEMKAPGVLLRVCPKQHSWVTVSYIIFPFIPSEAVTMGRESKPVKTLSFDIPVNMRQCALVSAPKISGGEGEWVQRVQHRPGNLRSELCWDLQQNTLRFNSLVSQGVGDCVPLYFPTKASKSLKTFETAGGRSDNGSTTKLTCVMSALTGDLPSHTLALLHIPEVNSPPGFSDVIISQVYFFIALPWQRRQGRDKRWFDETWAEWVGSRRKRHF